MNRMHKVRQPQVNEAAIFASPGHRTGYLNGYNNHERFTCRACELSKPDNDFQMIFWGNDKVYFRHPLCDTCRKVRAEMIANHPAITPDLLKFLRNLRTRSAAGAYTRHIIFALNVEDLAAQYIEQKGRCTLSGRRLTWVRGMEKRRPRTTISIDRIDSSGNYTLDNIHLVCQIVNIMKSDMKLEDFGEWCKTIVMHSLGHAQTET
jgi:hypothetical protein